MAGRANRRVSLQEVADAAGVSVTTASFALSGPPPGRRPPAADTKARIEQIADALGYAPNRSARAMRTSKVASIVLAPGEVDDYWSIGLAMAVRDKVTDSELATLLLVDQSWYNALRGDTSACAFITTEGLVGRDWDRLRNLAAQGVRLVLMADGPLDLGTDQVISDGTPCVPLAYRRLRARHQRVGFVAVDPSQYPGRVSPRLEAFQAAAQDDFDLDSAGLVLQGGSTLQETFDRARSWLSGPDAPSAVVCQNATMAYGVVLAAKELGLVLPDDLELISLGDVAGDVTLVGSISSYAVPDGLNRVADCIVHRAQADHHEPIVTHELTWEYLPGSTTRD